MKHTFKNLEKIDFFALAQEPSLEVRMEMLKFAFANGIDFDSKQIKQEKLTYISFQFSTNELTRISRLTDSDTMVISEEEFIKALKGEKVDFKPPFCEELFLNSDYTAIITKKGIKVGCQKFTHEQVSELYKISEQAQKSEK